MTTKTRPAELAALRAGDDRLRAALVDLTPAQALAAHALATGSTHDEAALAAGVRRETVTNWVNHHPGFQAALDRYRHALETEQLDVARRIRGKALVVVEQALDTGDLAAALAVLRIVRAPDLLEPATTGERMAAEIGREMRNVPPLPIPRDADGRVDWLSQLANRDTINADVSERAERIAVERLAEAAGVSGA